MGLSTGAYKVMRSSSANHYRRMLPSLLSVLEFRSNNTVWRPVLAALDWIRSKVDDGCRFVPMQDVPIDEGYSGQMAQFGHRGRWPREPDQLRALSSPNCVTASARRDLGCRRGPVSQS